MSDRCPIDAPVDVHNQDIFPQIRTLFSNFQKKTEETTHPSPSSL